MQIFCDFDGTVTSHGTSDILLAQFGDPKWEALEAQWEAGLIGSAACMQQQIAMINASQQDIDTALDEINIDPGFSEFVRFCSSRNLALTIISDGVDYFIKRILARHKMAHLPIIANRLVATGASSYKLEAPYAMSGCTSGVCKCQVVDACADVRIYIGDGHSDFCPVSKADLIFAKHALADYCDKQSLSYIPFQNFSDVQNKLMLKPSGFTPLLPKHIHQPLTARE